MKGKDIKGSKRSKKAIYKKIQKLINRGLTDKQIVNALVDVNTILDRNYTLRIIEEVRKNEQRIR